jgi:hypothetical protein
MCALQYCTSMPLSWLLDDICCCCCCCCQAMRAETEALQRINHQMSQAVSISNMLYTYVLGGHCTAHCTVMCAAFVYCWVMARHLVQHSVLACPGFKVCCHVTLMAGCDVTLMACCHVTLMVCCLCCAWTCTSHLWPAACSAQRPAARLMACFVCCACAPVDLAVPAAHASHTWAVFLGFSLHLSDSLS